MRILFVCKYNRFRSRIAEFLFKKYNQNKKIIVESAGVIRGTYPLDKKQVAVLGKIGIYLAGKPRGLSSELLNKQDVVVIVADNVPAKIFKSKAHKRKIIVWKIPDTKKSDNENEIQGIAKLIENKVIKLVRENE